MYHIKNAWVECYNNSSICYVSAKIEDQSYETLMKLGRGKMYTEPNMSLKYRLGGNYVFLNCEV